jgi:hypothetical protein
MSNNNKSILNTDLVHLVGSSFAGNNLASSIAGGDLSKILDSGAVFSQYIDNEQDNLTKQQRLLTDATNAKNREVMLMDSARKRTQDYSYMMYVVCIFLGVMLILAFLKPSLSFIPGSIFDMIIALLAGGAVIYVISSVTKIRSRDTIEYDRLYLKPPPINPSDAQAAAAAAAAAAAGSLVDAGNLQSECVGSGCCSDPTMWNGSQCGMTTMSDVIPGWANVSISTEKSDNKIVVTGPNPYTPSETTSYSFL